MPVQQFKFRVVSALLVMLFTSKITSLHGDNMVTPSHIWSTSYEFRELYGNNYEEMISTQEPNSTNGMEVNPMEEYLRIGFRWYTVKFLKIMDEYCRNQTQIFLEIKHFEDGNRTFCNSTWDSVSCWPTTEAGQLAFLPCPTQFDNAKYNPLGNRNASRMCYVNATWDAKSDYNSCYPMTVHFSENFTDNYSKVIIFYVGYSVSICALVAALSIFLLFKSLLCLRNIIHCHLIVTFIIKNLLWIILISVLPMINAKEEAGYKILCKALWTAWNYFNGANFFWMLVEGLYLHVMVVWAFSIDKVRLLYCTLIGWGIPGLVMIPWVFVKIFLDNDECVDAFTDPRCSCWMSKARRYYYIYEGPILLVLLVNTFILGSVVYVLVTKLRASNSIQTKQYRKAVKAILILFPLLGVTHVLLITSPSVVSSKAYAYFVIVLQSMQGLAVAVFFCFFNDEVRSVIRAKFTRWQECRSFTTKGTRMTTDASATQPCLHLLNSDNSQSAERNSGKACGGGDSSSYASTRESRIDSSRLSDTRDREFTALPRIVCEETA